MPVTANLGLERTKILGDRTQSDPSVFDLVPPIQEELQKQASPTIELIDLRRIPNERHALAHHPGRSVADQRALIANCPEITFTATHRNKSLSRFDR